MVDMLSIWFVRKNLQSSCLQPYTLFKPLPCFVQEPLAIVPYNSAKPKIQNTSACMVLDLLLILQFRACSHSFVSPIKIWHYCNQCNFHVRYWTYQISRSLLRKKPHKCHQQYQKRRNRSYLVVRTHSSSYRYKGFWSRRSTSSS